MAETQNLPIPKSEESKNLITSVYTGAAESTYRLSPMVPDSYKAPWNPDDIWQKKGDYSIYEDMIQDDQVSVCLRLKKDLILGSGYEFISEGDDQSEIIKDLENALNEDCEVPFMEQVEELLSAFEFGFSLTEKIFKVRDDGKLRLKALRTRHPNTWLLHQDPKGNITKYEQDTTAGRINVDPKSLIHYVNNRKFQNPYGMSDLRPCYNAWFTKRQVIKYFGIFLEKAASPIPVARYDKNAPAAAVEAIFQALKRFQTKTALTIPKEIEVEFLEAKNAGEAYSKAIDIFNLFIGRALFIPDLLGISGSETSGGSFSLGKEQIKLFFLHIYRKRQTLEKVINDHIVKALIQYNFGNIENYPKFRFKALDESEAMEAGKIWLDAVKSRVFKPNEEEINYFRRLCRFPEGEFEETDQAESPQFGKPQPGPVEPSLEGKELGEQDDEPNEPNEKAEFAKVYSQVAGDYHKKCNFKAMKAKLDDYDNSVVSETAPIVKKMFLDLYDQIEKKKILKDQKVERIDSLKLKYLKELKQVLKNSFNSIYKDGMSMAQQELFKEAKFRAPLAADAFMDVLEAETFQYIGDYQYKILSKVKTNLISAIKDGKPLSEVLDILDDEGKQLSDVSLERFARTKHTEVMNKGRHAFFEESGVVAAYQYSAIMDERTSDICSGLHNTIFKAGDEPIPPMHFNCRSVLIPITKYEEFTPTEKIEKQSIDEFIDENKGTDFATK